MVSNRLFIQLFKDLESGKLALPALPDTAIKIRSLLNQADVDMQDAADLIRIDPNLSTYILKVANSVHYQRSAKTSDITTAIMRMGYITTRNISTTYAMRSLFKPKVRRLRPLMSQLWQHSAELGATTAVLAKRTTNFSLDEAMTAGLIQDIGVLPIIEKIVESTPDFEMDEDVHDVIEKYASKVGALVLHKWNFESDLVNVVRARKDWHRDPQPEPDMADVVLIARLHNALHNRKRRDYPPMFTLPAFKKLGLMELGVEEGLAILEDSKEEIQAVRSLLV